MARPIKDGVDYFPKDTDFYNDDKVRLLRAEFGAKGMYVLDYILCDLYGKNGYFTKWDDSKCYLVSDGAGCGCTPNFIAELVSGCIRCSIFDKRVFDKCGVLTSAGIQRRYIRMFNSRDEIVINRKYWLLNEHDKKDVPASVFNKLTFLKNKSTENPVKSTENPVKSTENSQSKVKDTNVSQSKVNNNICDVPKEILTEWESYVEMRKLIKKPMTNKAKELALNKLNELAPDNFNLQKNILNQSVMNSWQGLFELKEDYKKSKPDYSNPHRYDNARESDLSELLGE